MLLLGWAYLYGGNEEQTDSDQRERERGITGEEGEGQVKEHVQRTHGQGQRGEEDWMQEVEGGWGRGE